MRTKSLSSKNEVPSKDDEGYEKAEYMNVNPLQYSEVRTVQLDDGYEYVPAEIESNSNIHVITSVNEAYGIL